MDKEARDGQRRWDKKIREKVNLSGKAVEHFSDEFRQIMDELREVDDNVRKIALGEEPDSPASAPQTSAQPTPKGVEGEDGEGSEQTPGVIDPGKTLKDLLRVAETNFKRREYMIAVAYLGRFHERMAAINSQFDRIKNMVDAVHHKFLYQDIDPEHANYLTRSLAPRFRKDKENKPWVNDKKKASTAHAIVVEAGISDWWYNINPWNDRGKLLSGWEKRFPKKSREIKAQTSSMLSRSQSLSENLLTTLKHLDTYRSTRKLEEYLQSARRWQDRYRAYNTAFATYYHGNVVEFIKYQKQIEDAAKEKKKEEETGMESLFNQKPGEGAGAENKPAITTPTSQEGVASEPQGGEAPYKTLPLLLGKEPLPKWDNLPQAFQEEYISKSVENNKNQAKDYDKLSDSSRRLYYNSIAIKLNKTHKKPEPAKPSEPEAAFPLVNKPQVPEAPPAPIVAPEPPAVPIVASPAALPHQLSFDDIKGPITEVHVRRPGIPLPSNEEHDIRRAHTEFLAVLESKATEHPIVQAAFVLDYAKTVESYDPEKCKQLRTLASSILGK